MAAVTNYFKLKGLKITQIHLIFLSQKSELGLTGLKSGWLYVSSGNSGRESFPFLFYLREVAVLSSWLHHVNLGFCLHISPSSETPTSLLQEPLWLHWAHSDIPESSPHLIFLNLITAAKFLYHIKWQRHRFQGLRHRHLWGTAGLSTTDIKHIWGLWTPIVGDDITAILANLPSELEDLLFVHRQNKWWRIQKWRENIGVLV